MLQLLRPLHFWPQCTVNSKHVCACTNYQYRFASNKTNDQTPPQVTHAKQRQTIEFSKSKSYPTEMHLHGIEEVMAAEDETPADRIKRYIATSVLIGITCFVIWAFYFSTYNLEFEERMTNTVPGYVDYMKKIDPNYEETIKDLKNKKARKDAMKRQNDST